MHTPQALFYGWIITACAFLVLFLTYGVQYSFGVFLPAMLEELGWQRASLAGAFSLYTMVYSGCSWMSGRLTDSWGPHRVIMVGGILLGGGSWPPARCQRCGTSTSAMVSLLPWA